MTPCLDYPPEICKVSCTTNTLEPVTRGSFASNETLIKLFYLVLSNNDSYPYGIEKPRQLKSVSLTSNLDTPVLDRRTQLWVIETNRQLWENCERLPNTRLQFIHLAFLGISDGQAAGSLAFQGIAACLI